MAGSPPAILDRSRTVTGPCLSSTTVSGLFTSLAPGPHALRALAYVHRYVYIEMKRRELERRLRDLGWVFERHGGRHDVWCNAARSFTEYVPRHAEINERLARAILKRAAERK